METEGIKEEVTEGIYAEKVEEVLCVSMEYCRVYNLALQLNGFSIVQEVKVCNRVGHELRGVELRFWSEPGFVVSKVVTAGEIAAGEERVLSGEDVGLRLDYGMMSTLTEMMRGELCLEVSAEGETQGEGGEAERVVLGTYRHEVMAYAPDQWLGMGVYPELLAAFVTPNVGVVEYIQTLVSEELLRTTGSGSVEGYQAGRARALEICSAIYRAVHSLGIQYSNPPASFGPAGQRIRLVNRMYKTHLGTCIETALLLASVMEACGLHPVLLMKHGHAFVGCHLEEWYFPDVPMDDLQAIRNRVKLGEFLVLESTCVTGNATFGEAEQMAVDSHLRDEENFECAIDIVRARSSGIRPLPLAHDAEGLEFEMPHTEVEALEDEAVRVLPQDVDLSGLSGPAEGRVEKWKQRLLDLSLRNRLLNVRDGKHVIPIACPDISCLEDRLAEAEDFALCSLETLLNQKDLHDYVKSKGEDLTTEFRALLEHELGMRRLWTPLSGTELSKRMTALYRQGKSDLEEGGINTLFLAIGFLEWKANDRDEPSHFAPILLVPIRMLRKSIREGIRVKRLDEETMINATLLEMLRSQFRMVIRGVDPLPQDESGVDVPKVLQIFRQETKGMRGWEVHEETRLGHFSFGKFIMWKDMTTRLEALQSNRLVNHLVNGGGVFDDGIEVFEEGAVAEHLRLDELYCPMSADSSQLAAVLYSQLGKSFVLHGPPGTGKSQTITNIIAHNLALGRRVLFVSEKKAALEVVHDRLSAIGLKPFCLELHSNKSSKTEVLAQFKEALEVPSVSPSGEWESTVEKLEAHCKELHEYVSVLHRVYPNGLSAYDCFSRKFGASNVFPGVELGFEALTQTREERETCEEAVGHLATAWRRTDAASVKALRVLSVLEWSPAKEADMLGRIKALQAAIVALRKAWGAVSEALAFGEEDSIEELHRVVSLLEALQEGVRVPAGVLLEALTTVKPFLDDFMRVQARDLALTKELQSYELGRFASLDFAAIRARIEQHRSAFVVVRFFRNLALLKELSFVKKLGGEKLTMTELEALLPKAEEYVGVHAKMEGMRERAHGLLGGYWREDGVDAAQLDHVIAYAERVISCVEACSVGKPERRMVVVSRLAEMLPHYEVHWAPGAELRTRVDVFLQRWADFRAAYEAALEVASPLRKKPTLGAVESALKEALGAWGNLRHFILYQNEYVKLPKLGLVQVARALEEGHWTSDSLLREYRNVYCHKMLDEVFSAEPVLCSFSATSHEERIARFCELDAKYTAMAREMVYAKLAAKLPLSRRGQCPNGTDLGILKHECEKRMHQMPVRQLLGRIPELVSQLKPCFLMSPLSVAQYLPADAEQFDLVVFDEASQIPVWDAIGVIARGKQLIVVGDPKQMPPTNFFQKGENEAEESIPDGIEDLESILDECKGAGVAETQLNWHYRSRHESLISFSNEHYYEGRLFTFPAARNTEELGVRFHFVPNGIYDRRATRTNRKEAEALVAYVLEHLENPTRRHRSIGIVTFSQAQKDLIEDLLEEARSQHPQLEVYFSDQNKEPLFVKNLENVQGDEREVILFSIGYAPDAEGKFSMNFGPLNRVGGERRLNVAITRAKEQVVVFSSIYAKQIDLSRTQATGAAHLREFLQYAETGSAIRAHVQAASSKSNGLANTLAAWLTTQGYECVRNVGSSGYRIDLAVRHPDAPEAFLLGIECDGPAYASQRTTRDRDSLRGSVLRSLGWNLYRAWSVDWTLDRPVAESSLRELLERLRAQPLTPHAPSNLPADDTSHAPENPSATSSETSSALPSSEAPKRRVEYIVWHPERTFRQELFYETQTRNLIRQQMLSVIETEGPICQSLLMKRILRAWNFRRNGDRITRVLQACLPTNLETTAFGDECTYWSTRCASQDFGCYRVSAATEIDRRELNEIPPEELANAMIEILESFGPCDPQILYRETVRRFGFNTLTAKANTCLDAAMAYLQRSGRV